MDPAHPVVRQRHPAALEAEARLEAWRSERARHQTGPGAGLGPVGAARLDKATLTVSVCPSAGEVSVQVGHIDPRKNRPKVSSRGSAADPVRAQRVAQARRAKRIRQWCVTHDATRLATFTFAHEPSLDDGWQAVDGLRRRLKEAGLPVLIVVQWGTLGGRLHFHGAVPRYIAKSELEAMWPHGFVEIRMIRAKAANGRTSPTKRENARACAGYVAGYLATDQGVTGERCGAADPGPPAGVSLFNRRRYSIPTGTVPDTVRFVSQGLFEALSVARALCGHDLELVWFSSSDDADWRGPPTSMWRG